MAAVTGATLQKTPEAAPQLWAAARLESWSRFDHARELVLELRFGEGGEDSKNFVDELFSAYLKYAHSKGFKTEILANDHGHILAKFSGENVYKAFANESGQHSCQRIPKTERNGRKHTSLISVAVLPIKEDAYESLSPDEMEITPQMCRLHAGGQNAQKNATAIRARHKETGITVFIQNERSQAQNKQEAIKILTARVNELRQSKVNDVYSEVRKNTLGDGRRGSKVRTWNFMKSRITDHRLGKKTTRIDEVMQGRFNFLFN